MVENRNLKFFFFSIVIILLGITSLNYTVIKGDIIPFFLRLIQVFWVSTSTCLRGML